MRRLLPMLFVFLVLGQVLYGLREAVMMYAFENYRIVGLAVFGFSGILAIMILIYFGIVIADRYKKYRGIKIKPSTKEGFYL